jgi:hypothetical protein
MHLLPGHCSNSRFVLDFLFEFKLLPKMDELQPTGTQHEYTIKFMWLMSHSSVEILEVVKRWFYH